MKINGTERKNNRENSVELVEKLNKIENLIAKLNKKSLRLLKSEMKVGAVLPTSQK